MQGDLAAMGVLNNSPTVEAVGRRPHQRAITLGDEQFQQERPEGTREPRMLRREANGWRAEDARSAVRRGRLSSTALENPLLRRGIGSQGERWGTVLLDCPERQITVLLVALRPFAPKAQLRPLKGPLRFRPGRDRL